MFFFGSACLSVHVYGNACLFRCVRMAVSQGILRFIPTGPLLLVRRREPGTLCETWLRQNSSSRHLSKILFLSPFFLLLPSTLPLCPLFLPCLLLQGSGQSFVQLKLPSFVCPAFFILVLIAMVVCLSWTPYFTLSSPLFDTPPPIRIPILGPL